MSDPSASALLSLSTSQVSFLQSLEKAELHAHLNGSIPLSTLQELAREYVPTAESPDYDVIQAGLNRLQEGVVLDKLQDFFELFPAIYALTDTPTSLARATRAVLESFLAGPSPQCTYLELRTTPRSTHAMSRDDYLRAVLEEIERYDISQAALIVSIDRRMTEEVVAECVELAAVLKAEGKRVVGLDICGDPSAGTVDHFAKYCGKAKDAGLGITVHIAEIENQAQEARKLLALKPDRLGHATFLNEEAKTLVINRADPICIELCLSSNLLGRTVATLQDHHIRYYFDNHHPIAICTDDTLPFRNTLVGEYALLMAKPPLGLGLVEKEIAELAATSLRFAFGRK